MKLATKIHHRFHPVRFQHNRRRATAAVLMVALSALAAEAEPIVIPNASFETPVSPRLTNSNPNLVPGWVFNVDTGGYYGILPIASNFSSAGTSSGSQSAYINNDWPGVTNTITSASAITTFAPLTTYTLTLAIGNVTRPDFDIYSSPGDISFSLLANGVAVATKVVPDGSVANGTFQSFMVTYTTPNSGGIIGQNLTLQIATLPEYDYAYEAVFDNVTLDATPVSSTQVVPEPQSSILILAGIGTLLWYLGRCHQTP